MKKFDDILGRPTWSDDNLKVIVVIKFELALLIEAFYDDGVFRQRHYAKLANPLLSTFPSEVFEAKS